jgi:hypothetical protein
MNIEESSAQHTLSRETAVIAEHARPHERIGLWCLLLAIMLLLFFIATARP